MNSQVKSRQRIADHGEVFTAQREVSAMCNLVHSLCSDYRSTFLEPACGTGNFLAEILSRKLASIHDDYERKSLIALSSLYGIDILQDNTDACRKRLFAIWDSHPGLSQAARTRAREILCSNIVCADTLNPRSIKLIEWSFPEGSITPHKHYFNLNEEVTGQREIPFTE